MVGGQNERRRGAVLCHKVDGQCNQLIVLRGILDGDGADLSLFRRLVLENRNRDALLAAYHFQRCAGAIVPAGRDDRRAIDRAIAEAQPFLQRRKLWERSLVGSGPAVVDRECHGRGVCQLGPLDDDFGRSGSFRVGVIDWRKLPAKLCVGTGVQNHVRRLPGEGSWNHRICRARKRDGAKLLAVGELGFARCGGSCDGSTLNKLQANFNRNICVILAVDRNRNFAEVYG